MTASALIPLILVSICLSSVQAYFVEDVFQAKPQSRPNQHHNPLPCSLIHSHSFRPFPHTIAEQPKLRSASTGPSTTPSSRPTWQPKPSLTSLASTGATLWHRGPRSRSLAANSPFHRVHSVPCSSFVAILQPVHFLCARPQANWSIATAPTLSYNSKSGLGQRCSITLGMIFKEIIL